MNVIDHRLDYGLALLQRELTRANSTAKPALDHRVDRFSLPTLSIYPVQASLPHQLGTRPALWSYHFGGPSASRSCSTTDRRNDIHFLHPPAIEPCISYQQPIPSSATTHTSISPVLAPLPA